MEYILYLLGGVGICAIFGGVIYVLTKKDEINDEERISNLTEEQKKILIETPYLEVVAMPNAALVHGLIYEIPKVTKTKASLVIMYNNQYYPNMRGLSHADINVPIEAFKEYDLKVGDYVNILLNEDKHPKVVF